MPPQSFVCPSSIISKYECFWSGQTAAIDSYADKREILRGDALEFERLSSVTALTVIKIGWAERALVVVTTCAARGTRRSKMHRGQWLGNLRGPTDASANRMTTCAIQRSARNMFGVTEIYRRRPSKLRKTSWAPQHMTSGA